jgi:hypothetical protein
VTIWVIPEDLGNFSPKKQKNLGEQKYTVFLVYAGSGSGQSVLIWTDPEHRESKEIVLCLLGWK